MDLSKHIHRILKNSIIDINDDIMYEVLNGLLSYDYFGMDKEHPSTIYVMKFLAAYRKKTWTSKEGAFRSRDFAERELSRAVAYVYWSIKFPNMYIGVRHNSKKLRLMERGQTDWKWFLDMWNAPDSTLKKFALAQPKGSLFSYRKASYVFNNLPYNVPVRDYFGEAFKNYKGEMAHVVNLAIKQSLSNKGITFR